MAIAAILLLLQIFVAFNPYSHRYMTQQVDVALANEIIEESYKSFKRGEPIKVGLFTTWSNVGLSAPSSYGYGLSMFAVSWCGSGLIRYLSGKRINVTAGTAADCTDASSRLWLQRKGDVMIACIVYD